MFNPMQLIQAFNQFKANYTGNPEQDVQRLLTSGRISQSQLNQLQSMASQFMSMLNGMK